jgi:hypothetical protein
MKKVRINTSLRSKLENYIRSQIDARIDQAPLDIARRHLEAEALRLIQAAYPREDMALLARYGKTDRYCRFTFTLPDGENSAFEFPEPLPHDLPESRGHRFEHPIEADAGFAAAALEVARIGEALRAEAKRQWKQAEVLAGCALYFEDVLDYLAIPDAERVNLAQRWRLPVTPAAPEAETEADSGLDADEGDESGEAPAGLVLVKPASRVLDALESLAVQADEDCPPENRSSQFIEALEEARDILAEARAA